MTTRAISLPLSCFIYRLSEPKPIEKWSTFIKKIFLGIFGGIWGILGYFVDFFRVYWYSTTPPGWPWFISQSLTHSLTSTPNYFHLPFCHLFIQSVCQSLSQSLYQSVRQSITISDRHSVPKAFVHWADPFFFLLQQKSWEDLSPSNLQVVNFNNHLLITTRQSHGYTTLAVLGPGNSIRL